MENQVFEAQTWKEVPFGEKVILIVLMFYCLCEQAAMISMIIEARM